MFYLFDVSLDQSLDFTWINFPAFVMTNLCRRLKLYLAMLSDESYLWNCSSHDLLVLFFVDLLSLVNWLQGHLHFLDNSFLSVQFAQKLFQDHQDMLVSITDVKVSKYSPFLLSCSLENQTHLRPTSSSETPSLYAVFLLWTS